MTSFSAIPEVDWSDLAADRSKFFRDLEHALCDVGFAVLLNVPGLEPDFQKRAFEQAHAFFSLPHNVKSQYAVEKSPHFKGYSCKGDGGHGERELVDIATEAFQLGPERSAPAPTADVCEWLLRGPNQWPSEVPGLHPCISSLHERYVKLARELGHHICTMLGMPLQTYDAFFHATDPNYIASMNYNQSAEVAYDSATQVAVRRALANVTGAGAHVDGAPFVTLLTADQPGLEVLSADKHWVDVPIIPGSVVVNIGVSLMKLSGGRCRATVHRVNPLKPLGPRVSLPFFLMPDMEGELKAFDGAPSQTQQLPGWPKRDRRLHYAFDRMSLFKNATRKWYVAEYACAKAAVEKEDQQRKAARARAAKL